MQDLRREIHFFDFVDNYYPKFKKLNTVTKSKWTKHDKTSVESSHPPKECILINVIYIYIYIYFTHALILLREYQVYML
jgi:hypothetical protein